MRGTKKVVDILIHIVKHCEIITHQVKIVNADYQNFISRENYGVVDIGSLHVLQIGELVTKLPPEFKITHSDMPWHDIINMRHRLVHGYELLKKEILWDTMLNDVPILNEKCRSILRELDPNAEAEIREELEAETIIYD